MKTSIKKRAWSLLLALTLVVTAICGNGGVTTAKAATTDYVTLVDWQLAEAQAGVETAQYSFNVENAGKVTVLFAVPSMVGVTVKIYKAGTEYTSENISLSDPYWEIDNTIPAYVNGGTWDLAAGDYSVSLIFDSATEYMIYADQEVAQPKISDTKATVTVGFTKTLSVENGTVKSWASSKKTVATVDKKGKVTGKKAGKTTITATLTDGTKLKCTVTVKANKYSASKLTLSDVPYNMVGMDVYSASFDSKGNLVIKARYVNNTSRKTTQLKNIRIVMKDGNGKTIGVYKQSKKSVSVGAYSTKDFTFTIKKASLKKTKADLRNSQVTTCDYDSYYTVYY